MKPLAALCLLLCATTARADDAREAQARSYFAIGQGHYKLGEFAAAIDAFEAGYRARPLPLFLFNLAQAARLSGRLELARDYYQQYLERETVRGAPQRAEARLQLQRVRRELKDARERQPAPPPPVVVAPVVKEVAPPLPPIAPIAPPPIAPPAPPVVRADVVAAVAAPAPERRPAWKRGWLWGTLGAVVIAGAGAGVGVWLAVRARAPARPSLGAVDF